MSISQVSKNEDSKENDQKRDQVEKQNTDAIDKPRPQNSPILSSSALFTTLSFVLPAVVARSGWSNLIFVPVCSAVLLLNPWVRTFLELKPIDDDEDEDDKESSDKDASLRSKKETFSPFDPARLVRQLNGSILDTRTNIKKETTENEKLTAKPPLDRSGAYAALRRMPASLRTPISDLEELIVRDCILTWYNYHSFGDSSFPNEVRYSIDHTIGSLFHATESMKTADVLADFSLAAASVLLVTLRYRRLHPNRAPIFANDETRIQALREALDRVFVRHARLEDGRCDILRTLLREIICKQIWNAICGIGEPDFINQQIVAWGERNAVKEDIHLNEGGYIARDGAQIVPSAAARSSPKPPSEQNAASYRKAVPVFSPPATQPSTQAPQTPAATRHAPTALAGEPLTTQPKAMTMPSPLAKSGMQQPTMSPTPMQSGSRPKITSPTPQEVNDYQAHLTSLSSADSTANVQRSKEKSSLPQPSEVSDASLDAWDDVMSSNLPPRAHEGMSLPDSIRDSMRSSNENTAHAPDSSSGYSIPETPEKRKNNPDLSVVTQGESSKPRESTSTNRSVQSPTMMSTFSPTGEAGSMSIRPPSRAPSAASGGIPPAPELFDVLSNKPDSNAFTPLRDAFENFLERGGVASRSLFFSPPSAATVAAGEGEALLKLHVGLSALARLVPSDSNVENDEIFREDAYGILSKAYHNLSDADDGVAGRSLREALVTALNQLQESEEMTLRQILRPVEMSLWNRLTGLYEYFWKETCTRPSGGSGAGRSSSNIHSGSNTPSRSSFASEQRPNIKRHSREIQGSSDPPRGPSMDLAYEPRKKQPQTVTSTDSNFSIGPTQSPTKTLAPLPEGKNLPRPASSPPMKVPSSRAPQVVERNVAPNNGQKAHVSSNSPSTSMPPPPLPPQKREGLHRPAPRRASLSSLEITVTDVSPNAERPHSNVDLRSFEVMIAVEGLVTESGGFVLLRNWRDFQQLREELNRSNTLPPLAHPPPEGRGKGSAILTREIEAFLQDLLTSPDHMTSEAVQYFVDKARAGESGTENSDRIGALMDSLQLSKGFNLGRNLASGMVNTIQKGTRTAVGLTPNMPGLGDAQQESSPIPSRSDTFEGVAGPELAHLPIGARTSQGGGREKEARQGLGISGNEWPRSDEIGGGGSSSQSHRRVRSSDLTSGKEKSMPVLGRSPTAPENIPSSATSMPTSGPASELSQVDLDNLLSCIFAIADEAFNLSGGWTFRRGMLRVFEQIVRTQYWSSILGVFNNMVHSLSHEQVGNWCKDAKVKFWPDEPSSKATQTQAHSATAQQQTTSSKAQTDSTLGEREGLGDAVVEAALDATQSVIEKNQNGTSKEDIAKSTTTTTFDQEKQKDAKNSLSSPPTTRTMAQKAATHARAQQILLSHVPSASAFFLGPGGRQSCERAVICVHEEITQPTTSLDLVLTVILKLCDIAAKR